MAMSDEERVLRDADKAYKQRVRAAEKKLEEARAGRLIFSYGKAKLFADRLVYEKEELALKPNTRTDVHATGAVTTGKDGKDTRELYLSVENANGGLVVKANPDDGEQVQKLAQKIRLAGAGATAAAEKRAADTAAATAELERVRADRSEIEAAERALTPDAIVKVRRRARLGWLKWVAAALVTLFIAAAVFGEDEATEDTAVTTQPEIASEPTPGPAPPPAVKPSPPAPRVREKPAPDIEDDLTCDYQLEGSGQPYRFVAGGDIVNSGNVSVAVRVRVRWRELGAEGTRTEKTYRIRRGQAREVNISVPTTIDGILAHQQADGACEATASIQDVIGPPPLE